MAASNKQVKDRWHQAQTRVMAGNEVLEAIRTEKERKRKSKRLKKLAVKVLKFFLSTAGLFIINGVILMVGAYFFKHLEYQNEQETCKNVQKEFHDSENATLDLLMNMATRLDGIGPFNDPEERNDIAEEYLTYLQSFGLSVLSAGYDPSTPCELMKDDDYGWSFTGSLLFALTVITTIGYGAIAPTTMWGRLVLIAYALIGIPVFLLFLANIGEVLANLFRIVYSSICCCGACRTKESKEKTEEEEMREQEELEKAAQVWRIDPVSGRPIPPDEEEEVEEEEEEVEDDGEDYEELTVPLTISVSIMLGFIVLGAVMFDAFEEDWSFVDSLYYCAITATTIGFGDLVPNIKLGSRNGVFSALVVILYIILSMAVFSMCLQLIADEIIAKFKWIGQKISMKKKASEHADEEEITTLTELKTKTPPASDQATPLPAKKS